MTREKQSGKSAAKRSGGRKTISSRKRARAANGDGAARNDKAATRSKSKSNGAGRAKRRANGGAQALDERQAKQSQAELLLSVSNKLAAHQTLDEQLQTLIDMTNSVLGVERGTLLVFF